MSDHPTGVLASKDIPCACRLSVAHLSTQWLLLLTGTPIQNNMSELYSVMNLVMPDEFNDCPTFLRRFGNPPNEPSSPEQLQDLQVRCPRQAQRH